MNKKELGLYNKFEVRRTDGQSEPGGKHQWCRYFVLDISCDPFATPALLSYAHACENDYPQLAVDIRRMVADLAGSVPSSETKPSEPQAKEESSTIQILPPTYPYDTRPSDWIIPIEPESVPIQESDGEK